jgi:hypothetical protein
LVLAWFRPQWPVFKIAVAWFGSEDRLDLGNKDIGRPTSNSAMGTPIVTTATTAGFAVPNSHIENITNSIATKPIKLPFIAVLIIAPKAASAGGLFHSSRFS